MKIIVTPDALRDLAARHRVAARSVEAALSSAGNALASLDWEVRQRAGIETDWTRARNLGAALCEQAESSARLLEHKAEEFEWADRAGTLALEQNIGGLVTSLGGWTVMFAASRPVFPERRVQAYARLGGVGNANAAKRTHPATLVPVPRSPEDQRALLSFIVDKLVDTIKPLKLLKDLWDMAHFPAWWQRVDQSAREHIAAIERYGQGSPEARAAYETYETNLEIGLFDMPLPDSDLLVKVRALIAMLNALAERHPVQ